MHFRANPGVVYLMFLPVIAYYIIFHYKPMVGVMIAFKNYTFAGGIWGSKWVGLKHFQRFLGNGEFWRIFKNTVTLAALRILFAFPRAHYPGADVQRSAQPEIQEGAANHFLFAAFRFLRDRVRRVLQFLLLRRRDKQPARGHGAGQGASIWAAPPITGAYLWAWPCGRKWAGGAIIYLASLSRVSPELYEAAEIDGAGKLKQILHVTLPAIRPIISIQFVRTMGGILSVSFDQTLVMNNVMVAQVADVLSYYIYQIGLLSRNQFSYATAMGLFDSALSVLIVILTNKGAKLIDEEGGLW